MPPASMKNTMLSPVAADLGMGDNLAQQVQDRLAEEERRKKLMGVSSGSMVARDLGLFSAGV